MPKIVWLDQNAVREHEIPDRGFLSLGRSADNTIVLKDAKVGRHHAKLVCGPHGCLLKDLKTGTGLEVNGSQVSSHFLRNGDVIRIGPHVLEYQAEDQSLGFTSSAKDVLTYRLQAGGPKPRTRGGEDATQDRAFLRFVEGPEKGRVQTVDRPLLPIGDPAGYYAAVSRRTSGHYLLNLGKGVYVKLNDSAVRGAAVALGNGDMIQLGDHEIEFRVFSHQDH